MISCLTVTNQAKGYQNSGNTPEAMLEVPLELAEILSRWESTYSYPLLTAETFKADGREGLDKRLRSVYWRAYLGVLPLPSSPKDTFSASYTFALHRSRREWDELRERYLTAPDGRSISGSTLSASSNKAPVSIDPLSLESSNPWGDWFKDLELREELRKDVLRTQVLHSIGLRTMI